ncbi:hypothetical protein KVR01_010062 [Diaporthe batatas]|uniref:uncharacterized protein n=1 Tax=Diaporthe batatas TaxID=748121 RepID=UPI001D03D5D7|nr:uncharacterized protein KVR01_010062 [Diaporthe batatas]KAG8160526.1 hypothetical protein KVR01_010062 [Diaporthe batatas]
MVRPDIVLLACLMGSATAVKQSQHSDSGRLHCGIFGSGAINTAQDMYSKMRYKSLKDKMFTIKPGQCDRVHCYDTTGIYVCNDGPVNVALKGEWIAKGIRCILDNCCKTEMTGFKYHNGISGQYFIKGMGQNMNINVGYGNCRDPPSIRPSNAGGWDVNGVCAGGVLNPASVNCEV